LEATLDMVLREDIFEKVTCRQKCEKEANTWEAFKTERL
jgi:hypothetical protein